MPDNNDSNHQQQQGPAPSFGESARSLMDAYYRSHTPEATTPAPHAEIDEHGHVVVYDWQGNRRMPTLAEAFAASQRTQEQAEQARDEVERARRAQQAREQLGELDSDPERDARGRFKAWQEAGEGDDDDAQ